MAQPTSVAPPPKRQPVRRSLRPMPLVQYKLVVFAVIVAMMTLFPVIFLDTWLLEEINAKLAMLDPSSAMALNDLLQNYKSRLLITYIGSLGILIAFSFAGGLFLTQKMTGPVYKVILFLQKVADGKDPGNFSLREQDDYIGILDVAINKALDRVRPNLQPPPERGSTPP